MTRTRKSILALAAGGALLLGGCATDPYYYDSYAANDSYYYDRPAYRYYNPSYAPSYYTPRYYGPPVGLSFGYSYHRHR
jgi:hypothetical protein